MSGNNTTKSISGLKSRCLSFPETLSQSVANLSPTATPVLVVPAVFALAGVGTVYAYLFATIALTLVALNISQFSKRSACPGSLYSFITRGAGYEVGFVAGWCLMAAYICCGMGVLSGCVNYTIELLGKIGVPGVSTVYGSVLVYGVLAASCWFVASKDIRLSTQMMLVLEVLSMIIILALGCIVLYKSKSVIDMSQLDLVSMDKTALYHGLLLAVFSYVGYESASTLGDEAKNPLKNIPRAIILTCIISGIFFMVTSYMAVLGFKDIQATETGLTGVTLGASSAPFGDLGVHFGYSIFSLLVSICAVISLWACTLASINSASRIIFTMGRHGVLHPHLGKAHTTNETPHHAVTLASALIFVIPAIMLFCTFGILDVFNDLSTVSTYGFAIAYLLVSVAAPFYLKKIGQLTPGAIVLSVVSSLCMLPVLAFTVYPIPPAPWTFSNYLPYLFIGYVMVGIAWFFFLKNQASSTIIEEIKMDLQSVHDSFVEHPIK